MMNLRKTIISGVKWNTIGTIGRSLFQLLQVSILTRFLPKEAFGLVAMALFVVNFSNIFIDMGMTSGILHRQNISRNEYSTIYWLNIFISFFLYVFLLIGSPFIARFYNEPELQLLVPIVGINLLLMSIGRQHRTIMQKSYRFKTISSIEMFSFFLGLIAAIFLAINNFGVYSLVYSTLVASLISNLLFLVQNLRSNPVLFHFKLCEATPFLKVGSFTVGSSLLDFFSRDFDILIIGKFMGAENLGLYSLSKQIVLKIYSIINPIILNVLSPVFSSIQKEKDKIKQYYLKVIYLLASLNFPIYLIIIILSKEMLIILYGYDFVSGYWVLSFLAISYVTNTISNPVGSLQIATGRTDIGFKWTIIRVLVLPIVIYFSSKISLNYVAASISILSILLIIPLWKIQLKPLANIQLKEYLKQFWKPYLIFLVISFIYLLTFNYYELPFNLFLSLLMKGIISTFIFLLLIYIFDKNRFIVCFRFINQNILKNNE